MKTISVYNGLIEIPEIALGCWRLTDIDKKEASELLNTALDLGINMFDHADVYGDGRGESMFSEAFDMHASLRDKIIIQSKCGIREGYYDFSKDHILEAVDSSLKRLKTDYIDVLLLHRPDILVEPEEVAEAFDLLDSSGKVKYFGVSNQNPMQIKLLKKYVRQPLIFNQMHLSLVNTSMMDAGINVNTVFDGAVMRDGSILDYCRLCDITIQIWSPLITGYNGGTFLDNPHYPELNKAVGIFAEQYGVKKPTIAIAWLLRHPAKMQPVSGATKIEWLKDICAASDIILSREEWYELYRRAGHNVL